ncbi:hypothetical protein TTHERM_00726070 (macronuclear) [Tetrahymena thermophila SB210]|uniref:Uncharacterized protein n=1 Tax=Tetrahymena thermophila (strain SB210) TaxID=312017 RepID=Q24GI3_TETTS|nr:hypothetical protein TTHERM_00726070 [Tetrahymena thermophila SB210]EAS06888.2 hypothetical protein TTHERM_00726070 [Tetrahymena thermophila SB210]|eukprot:XP_001027130.2 hypothetical protein TTHERM_00726070 [Tetrahymena thermophila SB210]
MIPKNLLNDKTQTNALKGIINKTCFKQLTMIRPELYLFSPVDIQVGPNQYVDFPNRYSRFLGEFNVEQVRDFIFDLTSNYSEEVKNQNQMNYILAQNQMPTLLYFSDFNSSTIFYRSFTSYFWRKLKFVWIPHKMNQVRQNFLKDPDSLPSFHLVIQGKVINCTDHSSFESVLNFIMKNTNQSLPNISDKSFINKYQFFSNYCTDCTNLYESLEKEQKGQMLSLKQNHSINMTEDYFWDITAHQSQLITQSSLNNILNIDKAVNLSNSQLQNENIYISQNHWVKDSYFNIKIEDSNEEHSNKSDQDFSQDLTNNLESIKNQESFTFHEFVSNFNIEDWKTQNKIFNRFTLFKGYEKFDLWEQLIDSLKVQNNIFTFREVDCKSKECTIWARQKFQTYYISFVIFDSSLTGDSPILIQNNLEIIQIYELIQNFVHLEDRNAIQEMSNDESRNFCNKAFLNDFICIFYFGNQIPLVFKVLSQQKFEKVHFIQVSKPSKQLLNKLGASLEQIVEVDNKTYLSSSIYNIPYLPKMEIYIEQVNDQIEKSQSRIQIVIECKDLLSCKSQLNVVKEALQYINYINISTIYYDTQEVFFNQSSGNDGKVQASIIFDQKRYTLFTINQYVSQDFLKAQTLKIVDQFIQIFNFSQNLVLIE